MTSTQKRIPQSGSSDPGRCDYFQGKGRSGWYRLPDWTARFRGVRNLYGAARGFGYQPAPPVDADQLSNDEDSLVTGH